MLTYHLVVERTDDQGSVAHCKSAQLVCDTSVAGRTDAFNPAELFLAAIAACMIKGIERALPVLKFDLAGVEITLDGLRQDNPPKMTAVTYEIVVDTAENDRRLDLLHRNLRKFGTISNTVADALRLEGTIRRRTGTVPGAAA